MSTFDFSTLYTKIPHNELKKVMNEICDFCFQGGGNDLLSISSSGARWVTKKDKASLKFTRELFKEGLSYLMDNCFFTFGELIFRQVIGIPMGSDPAPFMANLFLYHFESKWVKNLKKENLQKARRFSNTFRFIDTRKRKILEAYHIMINKPSLNDQKDIKSLLLFRNGIT